MKKDLISMDDLTIDEIKEYLKLAEIVEELPEKERVKKMPGKIMAAMFFEASTRTRLSFESAMYRLGGSVIGFAEQAATSVSKGESFTDTVHTIENYADIMVIRHPGEGTARVAAEVSFLPVVNAGDGTNQHPTQTLLDLYTIEKFFGKITGLKIAFAGDLKYSRTVHSLLMALMKFKVNNFMMVSPELLKLPEYLKHNGEPGNFTLTETDKIEEAINSCDMIYMTRIQKERFPDILEYEKVKDIYVIDKKMLKDAPEHLRIMHPLPRVNEIAYDVDSTVHAGYFPQARNGIVMRQAILLKHLGVKI
jgi:aspartate carbamoyltransferase catalytic subunit